MKGRSDLVEVTRRIRVPDALRLERYAHHPELGPRILFFSGGSAIRRLSQRLIDYTHNSIHLITPFDSGGSSAEIRRAFRMLAVGDFRNRLMALADRTVRGQPDIFRLFAFRFPEEESQERLLAWLREMVDGEDPMVMAIEDPMRKIIRSHMRYFAEHMPGDFDLRGASIGNLILTGGFVNQNRHIDPVIFLFSKLVEVRGVVRPVATADLHLAAELESGRVIVGQHRLTGKETAAIESPIRRIWLTESLESEEPVTLDVRRKVTKLIGEADLVCYPMGSFYTSLLANFLPAGVGTAVAGTGVPKVFVPNTGRDPESLGLDVPGSVERLLEYLGRSADGDPSPRDLLDLVLVDSGDPRLDASGVARIESLGPRVVSLPLVTSESAPLIDAGRVAEALLSLA